jgi:hypothetical protein
MLNALMYPKNVKEMDITGEKDWRDNRQVDSTSSFSDRNELIRERERERERDRGYLSDHNSR